MAKKVELVVEQIVSDQFNTVAAKRVVLAPALGEDAFQGNSLARVQVGPLTDKQAAGYKIGAKLAIIGLLSLVAGLFSARAQSLPVYTTLSSSGTTTSVLFFASSPLQQCRIVQAIATSDAASSWVTFKTGTTPLSITKSNAADTTIDVARTNGFAVNDFVILEQSTGWVTNAQIASFTGATNITFKWNVPITLPGDQIYKLGTATALPVGAANKVYSGEAIFVGNRGRPIQVIVNGTSACSLDAITGRYE